MSYLQCFRSYRPELSRKKLAAMSFLLILLRVLFTHKFFNVSFRAFGLESGKTSRLKPGERVLKSRSESTAYAYTPDTEDSADLSTPFLSSSRSVSPTMSNTQEHQNQNTTQANLTSSQNVHPNFFNAPLVYPTIPTQAYGGPAPNPPAQNMYAAAPPQEPMPMYSQAQMFQMMTNMQQLFRNTSFCTYVKYKNNR